LSRKTIHLFLFCCLFCFILVGCAEKPVVSSQSSGNSEYERQKIIIEGDVEGTKEVSVAEMRQLPQQELDCSFQRTTGLKESFKAAGPKLSDVLAHVGVDVKDFKGIGFIGRDGYYCLVTPEVIANREVILALAVDREVELPENLRPARLCVQGEFGPYWVRMVDQIVLYKEIPKKEIASVWVFKNLAEGIEPYPYEYYGSKDDAIELAQILARFDNVNSKAFFTMKSADGFTKHEAISMVNKRYYIKVEGKDAPMNISPNIKLGMNVKHIAWVSTNADAAVFPEEMIELIGESTISGIKGLALDEMLEEVQMQDVEDKQFEVIGVDGESVKVSGKDLSKGLLVIKDDGTYPVVWLDGTDLQPVSNLLRIRLV
jgi:DMSO/TMAO reductase YedYZ molybdopterin-dependent catalytic subunit